jgi:ring-1,2-phenylacetyl-CoA epoxidase subunit PaaD
MVNSTLTISEVWKCLEIVKDPEIPVVSILDLKIVTSVEIQDGAVTVQITPTFTGCPALDMIAESIRERLHDAGFERVNVKKDLSAAWSTDMLDDPTRRKLNEFGIAPPESPGQLEIELPVFCPNCGSSETQLENSFGPTLCRQIYYCNSCRQSFEKFKSL